MTFSSHGWGYCEVPPTKVFAIVPGLDKLQSGVLIGMFASPGKMLSCRILLDNGAMISKLPLNKVNTRHVVPGFTDSESQLWDCLSFGISCNVLSHVKNIDVKVRRNGLTLCPTGKYLFTLIPWGSDTYADKGDEIGYKDLHVIETPHGLIAYPNSNICWYEKSHVTPFDWKDAPKIKEFPEVPSI